MPKRKCGYCNKFFNRDEMLITPVAAFCTTEHRFKYGYERTSELRAKTKKLASKQHNKERLAFNRSDIKKRKDAAKKACHDYIRARDKGSLCICCDKPMNGQIHAGHWQESGNNSKIRYNEFNINAQRAYCNTYKGGDSGGLYEKNLRIKFGNEKVDWLLNNKGGTIKRTADDYLEIEMEYKKKLNSL